VSGSAARLADWPQLFAAEQAQSAVAKQLPDIPGTPGTSWLAIHVPASTAGLIRAGRRVSQMPVVLQALDALKLQLSGLANASVPASKPHLKCPAHAICRVADGCDQPAIALVR